MLRIHIKGFEEDCIRNVTGYFNFNKKKEWLVTLWVTLEHDVLESPFFSLFFVLLLGSSPRCLTQWKTVQLAKNR